MDVEIPLKETTSPQFLLSTSKKTTKAKPIKVERLHFPYPASKQSVDCLYRASWKICFKTKMGVSFLGDLPKRWFSFVSFQTRQERDTLKKKTHPDSQQAMGGEQRILWGRSLALAQSVH